MKKVAVLGAGMVGRAIALNLSEDHDVKAFDYNLEQLQNAFKFSRVKYERVDLSSPESIKNVVNSFDIVVGALPGFLGKMCLKSIIEVGKNIVDIAFSPEDPFELDELAKSLNVTAIVDCGVAPGMSNLFAGYHQARMKQMLRFECLVGGLPKVRIWPFEYKAPFSPIDVIEEYTRPARYVENGNIVVRPALSDPELIEFKNVGTLEAFNTDGLRTLIKTINCPNMKEKTLRYPGHINFIKALRDIGFFSKTPIKMGDANIIPLEFTSKLIFPHWKLKEDEQEFTVMRVIIEGINFNDQKELITYDLFDSFDSKTQTSSMARTTGYTCCAAVRLITQGIFNDKGICPPEYIGKNQNCYEFILEDLKKYGVIYEKKVVLSHK